MHAGDVENPNNHGGAGSEVTPEPDPQSEFFLPCCVSCMACTILAASAGLVLLFLLAAHAATAVRVLAGFGLVVGIVGLAFGALCCVAVIPTWIHGNEEGTRQAEVAA